MKSGINFQHKGLKGAVNGFLARRVEKILSIPGQKLYKKFVKATLNTKVSQQAVLAEILNYAKDTVIGNEHGFGSIESYDDYHTQVPVRDYEDHRPYVDRHTRGEENVLFPGKPLMYNRSSGTTMLPKLIPVTPYSFQRTIKDRGKLWLYGLSRDFPGVYKGQSFSVVSPSDEGHTEDGTPFGSVSGVMRRNIPEFMKLTHSPPYCTTLIENYDSKVYTMIRFSLACDVSVMFTGNPATVLNFALKTDEWKEDLIRDIHDGTLKADLELSSEIRNEVESYLQPAPERANELNRIASSNDRFRPAEYWPNLKLIHTWKNGNTRLVIPKLGPWFRKDTPILDFGYIASEIMATDLIEPETDGSILQVQNGFYEFTRYEDEYKPGREFLMAHQLEVGQRYYIYVTTFSGLYRYDMNDVIEVVGYFNSAPILRFLFKGKGITNMQGEKLSEEQFIEAVAQAAKNTGISHDFFIGYPDTDISGYKLNIEFLEDYSDERIAGFREAVDKALCRVNVEYEAKLSSQRLKPIEIVKLGKNSFSRYRALRLEEGAHEGQIKWLHLSGTKATKERIRKLLIEE
ncbi:MAG: GH3 auxin-responsive promoter family protein [Deltaproteobacteria bacterium]|nr:GH3 auxin-responsive promoter family protein [Deltaproteobacteria bacterium]